MGTAMKSCRVCGKEYEACRSANRAVGVFRWQEVACSEECGMEYLKQINMSRNPVCAPEKPTRSSTTKRSKPKANTNESMQMAIDYQSCETDNSDTV